MKKYLISPGNRVISLRLEVKKGKFREKYEEKLASLWLKEDEQDTPNRNILVNI